MSLPLKFVQKRGEHVTENEVESCKNDAEKYLSEMDNLLSLGNITKPAQHYGACEKCGHRFDAQEYLDCHTEKECNYCPDCCPKCNLNNDQIRIIELEGFISDAVLLIEKAVEIMDAEQVGQWAGVRTWQERVGELLDKEGEK